VSVVVATKSMGATVIGDVAPLALVDEDGGDHREADHGEELVGDAEHRPDGRHDPVQMK
jgi:hypothetical protein